jgi:hypothetical protein
MQRGLTSPSASQDSARAQVRIRDPSEPGHSPEGHQLLGASLEFLFHRSELRYTLAHRFHALTTQLLKSGESAAQGQDEPLYGPRNGGTCTR